MKTKFLIVLPLLFLIACGGGGSGGSSETTTTNTTNNNSTAQWSIDTTFVQDGGPGKDGIPSLDQPSFQSIDQTSFMFANELIIGVKVGEQVKGYPHKILDWHEVVNDSLDNEPYVLSYCPLTGSAMAWIIDAATGDTEFGVSGILYNSNLILYDRNSDSNWPQMLMAGARGEKSGVIASQRVIFETTWERFKLMYPDAQVLSDNTGFSRNYNEYPYGSYKTDSSLLFNVNNSDDTRLHKKERVLGVKYGEATKAYTIAGFASDLAVINDTIGTNDVVIIGSEQDKFAAAFDRIAMDGTLLTFSAEYDQLPVVMSDDEGNLWDINGMAISGPRAGEQLTQPFSYIAYWFAWTAFFPETSIYTQ